MAKKDFSHERLREVLDYNPETGEFRWLVDIHKGRFKAGQIAGTKGQRHRMVWVDGWPYLAHRVAWFWMTGRWPENEVDHKNLDGFDNRWTNIREATTSQNGMNRRGRSASGVKGVYFQANPRKCGSKPWKASIAKDGKSHHLGNFATKEEAAAARAAATLSLHGEFARIS